MFSRWKSRTCVTLGICAVVLLVSGIGWRLRRSPEYLTGWGSFLSGVGTLAIALGAAYAGYVAISEYREKTQVDKGKWLSDLFKQLFVAETFRKVRQKIDFNDLDDVRDLLATELASHGAGAPKIFSQQQRDLLDSFTDYLNFFEFVGLLRRIGRLTDADVKDLFDYYIRRLVEVDSDHKIRLYLRSTGFENLNRLLNRVSQYVFVYGTLKKGGVRHKLIAHSGFKFVADAKVHGRLYSLPGKDYPAGTFAPASSYVYGELYRMTGDYTGESLNDIDREEGVDEALYARVLMEVETDNETVDAWVYAYLQPVDEALEIPTGVFPPPVPV